MMASRRLCVRLLSGDVVYEGCVSQPPNNLRDLAQLRCEVAAAVGCSGEELVFCSGGSVLDRIEDAEEQITAVRDEVMGLLREFLGHVHGELPEHLWQARGHRGLLLAAVANNGYALQHASAELRADEALVLVAVAKNGDALL